LSAPATLLVAYLLAIRLESLVKLYDTLCGMVINGQGEENFFRYSLVDKPSNVLEPEALVVHRMSHETASPLTKGL
jgi:hypothetical protein